MGCRPSGLQTSNKPGASTPWPTITGLFNTELIKPRGPWRTVEQVEIATLEYVDWFNHRRLFEACGEIPPAELDTTHYRQHAALIEAGYSTP